MPSFDNTDDGSSFPGITFTNYMVEIKPTWGADWQAVPYLECLGVKDCCAPLVPQAKFRYRCGQIKREDDTEFSQYDPQDLRNWYVRVWLLYEEQDPQVEWGPGIIVDNEIKMERVDIASGDEIITAHGIPEILDRFHISKSYIDDIGSGDQQDPNDDTDEDDSDDEDEDFQAPCVDHVFAFNERPKTGYQLRGNKSDVEGPDDVFVFSDDGNIWNAQDVCEYLLEYFTPYDMIFNLVGQTDALQDIELYWNFAAHKKPVSCWDALKHILNHTNGLGFYLSVDPQTNEINVNVFTVVEDDITIGDKTLPGNPNTTDFTVPTNYPQDHLCDDINWSLSTVHKYDQIIVYGSEIKCVLPVGYSFVKVNNDWSDSLQNDYNTGADPQDTQKNAIYRQSDKFEDVYRKFVVDPTWDGTLNVDDDDDEDSGQSSQNVLPIPKDDGSISFDTSDGDESIFFPMDVKFEHNTPFLRQVDYSTNPITDNRTDKTKEEYLPFIVLYYDFENGAVHTADSSYHFAEKLAQANSGLKDLHHGPLTDNLGFKVHSEPNHYTAFGLFQQSNGQQAGASTVGPELDPKNFIAIGMFNTYRRPRVVVDLTDSGAKPEKKLEVYVDAARYVYAVPGCPFGVDTMGNLNIVSAAQSQCAPIPLPDGTTEDTTAVLKKVAAQLKAWYGQDRQTLEITLKQPGHYVELGTIITQVNTVNGVQQIGTIVTSRETHLEEGHQSTTIRTSYLELDYGHMAGRKEDFRMGSYDG